jgi:uncharacterized heparinase superfamily protein
VRVERNESDEGITLSASHDGYRTSFGLVHERRWHLDKSGDLQGVDVLVPEEKGVAAQDVVIRFHLHPAVRVSEGEGGVRLVLSNEETWLFAADPVAPRLEESVFFPTTDRPRRTEQIVLAFNTRNAKTVNWEFRRLKTA